MMDNEGVGTVYVGEGRFPVRYDKKTKMAYANLPQAIDMVAGIGVLNQEMTECLEDLQPHILKLLHQARIWHHLTPDERRNTQEYVEGCASEDPCYAIDGGFYFDRDGNPDYMLTMGDHQDFWEGWSTSTRGVLTDWHYLGMTASRVLSQELDTRRVGSYVRTSMEEIVAEAWLSARDLSDDLCTLKSCEIRNRAYAGVEFCFWPEGGGGGLGPSVEDLDLGALPPKLLEISRALMSPYWTEAGPRPQEVLVERLVGDKDCLDSLLESARVKLRVVWLELLVEAAESICEMQAESSSSKLLVKDV
jgi:hypothetical protein